MPAGNTDARYPSNNRKSSTEIDREIKYRNREMTGRELNDGRKERMGLRLGLKKKRLLEGDLHQTKGLAEQMGWG